MPATGHPAAQLLRQPQLPEHVLVGFDARLPLLLVLAKLSGIVPPLLLGALLLVLRMPLVHTQCDFAAAGPTASLHCHIPTCDLVPERSRAEKSMNSCSGVCGRNGRARG